MKSECESPVVGDLFFSLTHSRSSHFLSCCCYGWNCWCSVVRWFSRGRKWCIYLWSRQEWHSFMLAWDFIHFSHIECCFFFYSFCFLLLLQQHILQSRVRLYTQDFFQSNNWSFFSITRRCSQSLLLCFICCLFNVSSWVWMSILFMKSCHFLMSSSVFLMFH